MILKFKKLDKDGKLGNYKFEGDAGLDLFSVEDKILNPKESSWVRTGIAIEIPKQCVGFIKEKSGLAQTFAVGAGIIDSSYRGEVKVCVRNLGNKELKIRRGQAIAQLVILPFVSVQTKEVLELSPTERGNKGFGEL